MAPYTKDEMLKEAEELEGVHCNPALVAAMLRQGAEAMDQIAVALLDRNTAQAELTDWQTCSMCHEKMEAPGHCSNAETEEVAGLRLMWEEGLTEREDLRAKLAAAEQRIADLETRLREPLDTYTTFVKGEVWGYDPDR